MITRDCEPAARRPALTSARADRENCTAMLFMDLDGFKRSVLPCALSIRRRALAATSSRSCSKRSRPRRVRAVTGDCWATAGRPRPAVHHRWRRGSALGQRWCQPVSGGCPYVGDLMKLADAAMYRAKRAGKNQVGCRRSLSRISRGGGAAMDSSASPLCVASKLGARVAIASAVMGERRQRRLHGARLPTRRRPVPTMHGAHGAHAQRPRSTAVIDHRPYPPYGRVTTEQPLQRQGHRSA